MQSTILKTSRPGKTRPTNTDYLIAVIILDSLEVISIELL